MYTVLVLNEINGDERLTQTCIYFLLLYCIFVKNRREYKYRKIEEFHYILLPPQTQLRKLEIFLQSFVFFSHQSFIEVSS